MAFKGNPFSNSKLSSKTKKFVWEFSQNANYIKMYRNFLELTKSKNKKLNKKFFKKLRLISTILIFPPKKNRLGNLLSPKYSVWINLFGKNQKRFIQPGVMQKIVITWNNLTQNISKVIEKIIIWKMDLIKMIMTWKLKKKILWKNPKQIE